MPFDNNIRRRKISGILSLNTQIIKVMSPVEFENLTLNEKAKLIIKEGVFLSKSKYKKLEITLYRVEDFFIEIWYEPFLEKVYKIDNLHSKKINPFLKHLNITSLN